jgi:hypothetical protein
MNINDMSVTLQITWIDWSGWKNRIPIPTRDPTRTETREVKKGDIINVNYWDDIGQIISIIDIKNDAVVAHFKTKSVVDSKPIIVEKDINDKLVIHFYTKSAVKTNEGYDWTAEIKYNEEYQTSTTTKDAGRIWKFTFIKKTDNEEVIVE